MIKKLFFSLTALMALLVACSGGDDEEGLAPKPTPEKTASITIDSNIITNGVTFTSEGGEKSISFTATADWTLTMAATRGVSWCTASVSSGGKGSATVKFTTQINTDYDDRSVAVTIKAGTASQTFTITQKCADALLVTADKFEVEQAGGTIEVEVKANIDYRIEVSETAKGWITESSTRALTARKHRFDIAVSEEMEKREGEIYIKSGDKQETVRVYQSGGPVLLLTQNEYAVSSGGDTITVDVKSNVEYGVEMPKVDWVEEVTATRGASSHTLKFAVAPNEGYDSRSAEIVFYDKNSDLKETLTLTQAQKDAIILSQKEVKVSSEGETIEVKLNSNVDFEVKMPDADWIKQSDTRGLQEHSLHFVVSANEGEKERSAEIVILNKENTLSETLKVKQKGQNQIIVGDGTYQNGVVSIAEAGTMKKLLGTDYLNVTSLKVVGPINGDDVYYLRKMLGGADFSKADWGKLTMLDLSEATIVEGGGTYYAEYTTSKNVIGSRMFYACTNLQSIILPENAISIGHYAFTDCESLISAHIGNNVTSIGERAFYSTSLTEIIIPDNVTSIGNDAFSGCPLKSAHIGNGVVSIGNWAFYSTSLTEIVIPDNVTLIGHNAFGFCKSLKSAHIGNGVTSISNSAFESCASLTEIVIPDNVTSIGDGAFDGCKSLKSAHIGNGVTSIGERAFCGTSLTEIVIPDNVTIIKKMAFHYCTSMTSAHIGKSVTDIKYAAFVSCEHLVKIYSYNPNPPSLEDRLDYGIVRVTPFDDIGRCTLYVPARSGAAYKSSWGSCFSEIIEMD